MRIPSVKTLSNVFEDAKTARRIMEMTRDELKIHPAGQAYLKSKFIPKAVKTWELRLEVLNSLESGLHGVEHIESVSGDYASYLNTGDTYAATLIYWNGFYRVQSLGDFVEALERQGIRFK